MSWNRAIGKVDVKRAAGRKVSAWWGVAGGVAVAMATVAGVVVWTGWEGVDAAAAVDDVAERGIEKKQFKMIQEVKPDIASAVYKKLRNCNFLLNGRVKPKAKHYLCLFSASWCPPCRMEMPRIAKMYAETIKDDPDVELVHFSCDSDESKALAWANEHDVKFPVVRPKGGNPLDLHTDGIPLRILNEAKLKELKE